MAELGCKQGIKAPGEGRRAATQVSLRPQATPSPSLPPSLPEKMAAGHTDAYKRRRKRAPSPREAMQGRMCKGACAHGHRSILHLSTRHKPTRGRHDTTAAAPNTHDAQRKGHTQARDPRHNVDKVRIGRGWRAQWAWQENEGRASVAHLGRSGRGAGCWGGVGGSGALGFY